MSSTPKVYKTSKMIEALQALYMGKPLVSRDRKGSNYNQYFSMMRNKYHIKLDEVSEPNYDNPQSHLKRRLVMTKENLEIVESVLMRLGGRVPSRRDESQKTSS